MNTLIKFIVFSLSIFLMGETLAAHLKPDACPGISDMQKEGMTQTEEVRKGTFITYTLNHFNTPINWVILIGPMTVSSPAAALTKGNKVLTAISTTPEPTYEDENGWICLYPTGVKDIAAFALQTDEMLSQTKLKEFLKKI